MNKVILIGRLTADPELRYTPSGTPVASFRIAVDRPFSNKQTGEKEADFINCQIWNKAAESLAKYMTKGRQIAVDGRLQVRSYDGKDGQKHWVTEVLSNISATAITVVTAMRNRNRGKHSIKAITSKIIITRSKDIIMVVISNNLSRGKCMVRTMVDSNNHNIMVIMDSSSKMEQISDLEMTLGLKLPSMTMICHSDLIKYKLGSFFSSELFSESY